MNNVKLHVRALSATIDSDFPKVVALVIALGDALSGSHILQNGRIDWGVATAAAVGVVQAHVGNLSWLRDDVWKVGVPVASPPATDPAAK